MKPNFARTWPSKEICSAWVFSVLSAAHGNHWSQLKLRILLSPRKWAAEMDQLRLQATDPTFLTQAAMSTDKNATNYTAKKGKYGAEKKCSKRKKKTLHVFHRSNFLPNLDTRKNRKPEFTGLRPDQLVRTCTRRGSTQGWAMSCHINVFKKPIPNEYFCIQAFWINFTPCAGQIDVKLTGTNQFGRA